MVGPAVISAAALAAGAGSSLVNLAFAPLFAANQYIGSYFFGSGMILGERDMYQEDWPKIKARLDAGESFAAILEEQTIRNTTAIMANAKDIVLQVKTEWNQIVFDYLRTMPQAILDLLGIPSPGTNIPDPGNCPEGFKWDSIQGRCRPIPTEPVVPPKPTPSCPPGFVWSPSAQQCVPRNIPEPTRSTPITFTWTMTNAQGRIFTQFNKSSMLTNLRGRWTFLKTGTKEALTSLANQAWPSNNYETYSFGVKNMFWTLKSKMPNKWHIQN